MRIFFKASRGVLPSATPPRRGFPLLQDSDVGLLDYV